METRKKQLAENYIKDIRRKTRRLFSSEQKIQIIMEVLQAESSIAELCRKIRSKSLPFTSGTKNSWKRARSDYQEI